MKLSLALKCLHVDVSTCQRGMGTPLPREATLGIQQSAHALIVAHRNFPGNDKALRRPTTEVQFQVLNLGEVAYP